MRMQYAHLSSKNKPKKNVCSPIKEKTNKRKVFKFLRKKKKSKRKA